MTALLVLLAASLPAQNDQPNASANATPNATQLEKDFGGDPNDPKAPGFRVRFDRHGAGVRAVWLLDHAQAAPGEEGDDQPYQIVREELADPTDETRGAYSWFVLHERRKGEHFPEGIGETRLWEVAEDEEDRLVFTLDCNNGLTLEKAFSYEPWRRDLVIEIALRASDAFEPTGIAEFVLELGGLALVSPRSEYVFGANLARGVGSDSVPNGDPILTMRHADGKRDLESPSLARRVSGPIEFAGSTNRFFGAFLYADDEESSKAFRSATMSEVPERAQFDMAPYTVPVANYRLWVRVPVPGQESRLRYRVYLGPKSFHVFDEQPDYAMFAAVVRRDLTPPCFCTIPGAQTMAYFLLWMLGVLHSVVGNWGVAIVFLTIFVRGALVPLNFRMQKSMRAYGAKMSKLKPKLDELQKKYANDKKQLQQQMVAFQREHKMFPPLGGCLPMFVTIPVFIGLFTALRTSYDMRHQPFLAWINDLAAPDALFEVGLGWMPTFNLLPLIYMAIWFYQASRTPLPSDPQQRQVASIMRWMPVVFGVLLYNYASALMVYWITAGLFALVEQRITRKILGPVSPEAAGFGTVPAM